MELRELLTERKNEESYRAFAARLKIDHSRLYRFLNKDRNNDAFGLPTIRHLARLALANQDQPLIEALADYALWGGQ